jgi:redox-sensitive bicupin YhaK (pirin superfamily)
MISGKVAHEDFAGHAGIIGAGDLQWMTAGRGIVHAEMPATGEENVGLQLWVNLPRSEKMCEPRYQELLDKDIPHARPEDGVDIKVIAGDSHGVKSPVYTKTPTMYLDFHLAAGKTVKQVFLMKQEFVCHVVITL